MITGVGRETWEYLFAGTGMRPSLRCIVCMEDFWYE
jgi:hypothetical protein